MDSVVGRNDTFSYINLPPPRLCSLGNRTYEHYNAIGRAIDRRAEELSGQRFYDRGEGDDDSSLEEDFAKWKKGLWGPLCRLHGLQYEGADESQSYDVYVHHPFAE